MIKCLVWICYLIAIGNGFKLFLTDKGQNQWEMKTDDPNHCAMLEEIMEKTSTTTNFCSKNSTIRIHGGYLDTSWFQSGVLSKIPLAMSESSFVQTCNTANREFCFAGTTVLMLHFASQQDCSARASEIVETDCTVQHECDSHEFSVKIFASKDQACKFRGIFDSALPLFAHISSPLVSPIPRSHNFTSLFRRKPRHRYRTRVIVVPKLATFRQTKNKKNNPALQYKLIWQTRRFLARRLPLYQVWCRVHY